MKVFRFLRRQFIASHKTGNYIKYAIGEIVLVVIGILIALQINNWNNNKILQKKEIQTYEQIKRQISDDIKEITEVKDLNNFHSSQFIKAVGIISTKNKNKIDSLAQLTMQLSQYSDFHGSGNIYETLVNSGDIKLINNVEISGKLQKLEMTYSNLNKLEDMHWEIIMNELSPEIRGVINYANMHVVKPEKLYTIELQNIFIEAIFLTKGKDSIYNRALTEMETIVNHINRKLNN